MPRNKEHTDLAKLLIGKGLSKMHKEMDEPSQEGLRHKHRVMRHGLFEIILNSYTHGVDGLKGTVLHIIQDKLSTLSKKAVKEILDADSKDEKYRLVLKQMSDMEKRLLKRALQEQLNKE